MGGVWYYPAMERIDIGICFLKITIVAILSVMFLAFLKLAEIGALDLLAAVVVAVVDEFWLLPKIFPVVENRLDAINPIKRRKFFVFWFGSVFGLVFAWWIPIVFELSGITRSLVGICIWAWITTFWYVVLNRPGSRDMEIKQLEMEERLQISSTPGSRPSR